MIQTDILCEDYDQKTPCTLYFFLNISQLSYKSFKIVTSKNEENTRNITKTKLLKGFSLKFSKFVTISADNELDNFEFKICKPREEENYDNEKKPELEINELIEINNESSEKEMHVCLTEKFSLSYRFFLSKKCQKNPEDCSDKFSYSPSDEVESDIFNASLYVGNEVFELKIDRMNLTTKIRVFKKHPERGITIETFIEKLNIEEDSIYGKEVFLVIRSLEIQNGKEFFTDLNGLYMKKRNIKERGDVSKNFYPITNLLYIEDEKSKIQMRYFINKKLNFLNY